MGEAGLGTYPAPRRCVILDNLATHKIRGVRAVVEAVGARLLYLPPYSPDFNPIEPMWSKIKQILRSQAPRTDEQLLLAARTAFQAISAANYGPGFFDFDNDGWKDLFVSRGHVESIPTPTYQIKQYNTVFRNPGATGKWQALTAEAGFEAAPPARHRSCAFGDFDGDGRVDIVVTALGQDAEIWMNRSENSGHWLDISLEGTKSNRDGIGARIKLVTSAGAQYNHMTTSVGYASSSHGPVHFGLGTDSMAKLIEIHWPSGIVQTLLDVPGDRVLRIKEPATN